MNRISKAFSLRVYLPHYGPIVKLGLPVVLAQLGQITVGLVDNMMIGHLGTHELAAASFANTIFWLVIIFGTGFSYSITPLVGEARGDFKKLKIGSWFKNGMLAMILMGILLTVVILLLSLLMGKMGQPSEIITDAKSYLWILAASILPMMIFMGYKQFGEGLANTKVAMNIMLLANLVNIAANYILINGKCGFPAMGLNGAGYGTLIARGFMAIAFFWVFRTGRFFKPYREMIRKSVYCLKDFWRIWQLGLPIGSQLVMEASAFMLSTIMMGWISVEGLAAHQIVLSLSTVSFMIYQGIAASTTIRISSLLGEKRIREMKNSGWAAVHLVLGIVVFMCILFVSLRHILPTWFTQEPAVIQLTAQFLIVMVIYQFFDALQIVFGSILRGMSDVNIPTLLTFVAYFLVSLPTGYLCAFVFGMNEVGIWWGLPAGLGAASFLFMLRFRSLSNKLLQAGKK
ncbi:MATE family efflux transporter [Labilibaculum euxinus]|uniref:Multidrug-efflux transporter n=1 Tax=Labilibaculum euxinus TaxID=2686357 RepID=A0A7M4D5W6_9BACT|nr:MATE family efflux transporter [Labilibaculum euxinus]MUP38045.1 MATE family efflux transporter [Labilibaculum euxinus]MVB07250.1 MATE family efflux transporter [Labilibaculum euxinus]